MQYLDNDMNDELFQRAADNYPLREGTGDWDYVIKKISEAQLPGTAAGNIAAAKKSSKNNKYKKIIPLAALLCILLSGWYLFQRSVSKISLKNNGTSVVKNIDTEKAGVQNKSNPANGTAKENNQASPVQQSVTVKTSMPLSAISKRRDIHASAGKSFSLVTVAAQELEDNNADKNIPNNQRYLYVEDNFTSNFTTGFLKSNVLFIPSGPAPGLKYRPANKNSSGDNKKKLSAAKKNTGFYIGIISGPDYSKVKSKPFNYGFDLGLLTGYQVNKKISFETGLIIERKNYTSSGASFNMSKVRTTMPVGMTINNLSSRSNILEIPLKIKYDFIKKNNSALFITGGVSSYVMTKETNKYNVFLNGNAGKFTGIYTKNDGRLFANATISAGYQHKISNKLDFKIEPFLKIPLQGVGVGSLPVTSAGLHIGIIRRVQ